MTMSKTLILILVGGMLFTGTVNTLLNKLQDRACVGNCDAPNPKDRKHFTQPLYQTVNMFIGEALCFVAYYILKYYEEHHKKPSEEEVEQGAHEREPFLSADNTLNNSGDHFDTIHPEDPSSIIEDTIDHHNSRSHNRQSYQSTSPQSLTSEGANVPDSVEEKELEPKVELLEMKGKAHFLLFLPTLCDLSATTLMNVGLISISASVYQMLRGSVVLFTGIFSVFFLKKKHPLYRWIALLAVLVGVGIVGISGGKGGDEEGEHHSAGAFTFGVICVVLGQVFTAFQYVIEEKLLVKYDLPALKAVGLEGSFGILSFIIIAPILHFTIGVHHPEGYFNLVEGAKEFAASSIVILSSVGIAFSIALFNWTGLAVTRNISATSRSTIDTSRTLFIWLTSLALGWESFRVLQVVGFIVLIFGTFLFNDIFGTFGHPKPAPQAST